MTDTSELVPASEPLTPEAAAALEAASDILTQAAVAFAAGTLPGGAEELVEAPAATPLPAPELCCDFCRTPFRFCAAYVKGTHHSICSYCVQASMEQLSAAFEIEPGALYATLRTHHDHYQVKLAAALHALTHTDEVIAITGPKS